MSKEIARKIVTFMVDSFSNKTDMLALETALSQDKQVQPDKQKNKKFA